MDISKAWPPENAAYFQVERQDENGKWAALRVRLDGFTRSRKQIATEHFDLTAVLDALDQDGKHRLVWLTRARTFISTSEAFETEEPQREPPPPPEVERPAAAPPKAPTRQKPPPRRADFKGPAMGPVSSDSHVWNTMNLVIAIRQLSRDDQEVQRQRDQHFHDLQQQMLQMQAEQQRAANRENIEQMRIYWEQRLAEQQRATEHTRTLALQTTKAAATDELVKGMAQIAQRFQEMDEDEAEREIEQAPAQELTQLQQWVALAHAVGTSPAGQLIARSASAKMFGAEAVEAAEAGAGAASAIAEEAAEGPQ
jgi:hypothetical protein